MPVKDNEDERIETCDLQLGDTWRGMQSKMSVTAPAKKIRKKLDSKPQSQVNKCVNEKKRRELENETINQLEELLGTCLAEVKQPDKNGIVREASRRIQDVLSQRRECPCESPLSSPEGPSPVSSPLQGGEISSTQPHSDLLYAELAPIIEAVKFYTNTVGLVLLEIDTRGKIGCVTENIRDIVSREKKELVKQPFFSLVHEDDHTKLKSLLRKLQSVGWPPEDKKNFQSIQARLIRNTGDSDDTGLEEVVIHAAPTPALGARAAEAGPVMCVIRRCDDAPAEPDDRASPAALLNKQLDQITFRLDTDLHILTCDLSGVDCELEPRPSLVGKKILELIEAGDRLRFASHLRRAACPPAPPEVLEPVRIRVAPHGCWVRVRSTSRLFRSGIERTEFIMSTHTVLGDDEPPQQEPFLGDFSYNDLDAWPLSFADMADEQNKDRKAPSPPAEEPNRLRLLLSKKPGENSEASSSNNRILKDLLKQEDEEATGGETSAPLTPATPHTPLTPHTPTAPPPASPAHHAHHSDMLLRILNDKSDENNDENRRNQPETSRSAGQPSALLTQLLSSTNGPASNGRPQDVSTDAYLERLAGVKRKFDETKPATAKRATPEAQQVSSSAVSVVSSASTSSGPGMSDLCQRNKILVSLLGRQPPPPLPNQMLRSYTPRSRPAAPAPAPARHSQLTNMLAHQARPSGVNGGAAEGGSQLQMVLQQGARAAYPPPAAPAPVSYAAPAPLFDQLQYVLSGIPRVGDNESNDQALSDILDEVINNLSDGERHDALLNARPRPDLVPANKKEKENVINEIRQSLMQCEKATKSPGTSSPNTPPVYPVHSPGPMQGMQMFQLSRPESPRAEQQRARLLQLQRSQQMLVSPEAAEQPQQDLGSTISALVTATPPNVSLTRTDYPRHLYRHHPANQIPSNYTNKPSTQQNPMLSRQLRGGYAHGAVASPAALTPLTPIYHRAAPPRPAMGGYYDDGAGYCNEYARRVPHIEGLAGANAAGGAGGGTSEYVRNELRAVVGARSSRPDLHAPMPPQDMDPMAMAYDMPTQEYYGGLGGGR